MLHTLNYDSTASDSANWVENEEIVLEAGGDRFFIPNYGSMYWDTISIVNSETGNIYTPGDGLYYLKRDTDISTETGKDVVYGIGIEGEELGSFFLSGFYVGGYQGKSPEFIKTLSDLLEQYYNGEIDFSRLVLPETMRPSPHDHGISDLREMEKFTQAFSDMAIAFSQNARMGPTGNRLIGQYQRLLNLVGGMQDRLNNISMGVTGVASQEDILSVREDMDKVVESVLTNATEIISMNARLSELETAFGDLTDAMQTDWDNVNNTVDVEKGTDYQQNP